MLNSISENNSTLSETSFLQKLWPCLAGETIANLPEVKSRRDELKSLISAPAGIYTDLYEATLRRFMEFCQAMPQSLDQPQSYSLLTTALDTALIALKKRRGRAMPQHSNSETISEQEPLWTYAVFTAALWTNFPDLRLDRTIALYKSEQEFLGWWHPIAGCLYEPKTFYKILPQPHPTKIDRITCLAGSLGRIIPAVALRWLSSESTVWQAWWEMMTHTPSERNELALLIQLRTNPFIQIRKRDKANELSLSAVKPHIASKESDIAAAVLSPEPSAKADIDQHSAPDQALADLNQWILTQCTPAKKWFVRIQSGVLIRYNALFEFIKEYNDHNSPELLIACLAQYLRKEDNQYLVRYHFVYDQNEEVVRGIILMKKYLCEALKIIPAENQFIQNLSLTIDLEEV